MYHYVIDSTNKLNAVHMKDVRDIPYVSVEYLMLAEWFLCFQRGPIFSCFANLQVCLIISIVPIIRNKLLKWTLSIHLIIY